MRRAPRLPHARRGPSMHLRVPGSLLQPAAPALVAGLSLADDVRANAGSYLTVSTFHKIGATPIVEDGLWRRDERDRYREVAHKLGVAIEIHYFDVPFDELW